VYTPGVASTRAPIPLRVTLSSPPFPPNAPQNFNSDGNFSAAIDGTYLLSAVGNTTASVLLSSYPLNQSYDAATNTWTATLVIPESNNGQLMMSFTNTQRTPNGPTNVGLVNLTVMQPGLQPTPDNANAWSTAFVTHLQRFDSLRFMDMLHTNDR